MNNNDLACQCTDGRFEIINKTKSDVLDRTNMTEDEAYSFAFRCWQLDYKNCKNKVVIDEEDYNNLVDRAEYAERQLALKLNEFQDYKKDYIEAGDMYIDGKVEMERYYEEVEIPKLKLKIIDDIFNYLNDYIDNNKNLETNSLASKCFIDKENLNQLKNKLQTIDLSTYVNNNMCDNTTLSKNLTCDICGKEVDKTFVCASTFGPISNAYCEDCLNAGKESYSQMVTYIACAGQFPEDINEEYQKIVREQLKILNVSEEKFIEDVKKEILDIFGN